MKKLLLYSILILILSEGQAQDLNWAITNTPNSVGRTRDIKSDTHNNIYITSTWYNSYDPDGSLPVPPFTSVGFYDSYYGKYSSSGQYLWGIQIGSNGDDLTEGLAARRTRTRREQHDECNLRLFWPFHLLDIRPDLAPSNPE